MTILTSHKVKNNERVTTALRIIVKLLIFIKFTYILLRNILQSNDAAVIVICRNFDPDDTIDIVIA